MFLMFFGLFLMFLSQLGYCNFGLCFNLEINAVKKINQIFDITIPICVPSWEILNISKIEINRKLLNH
jgi:hypothetical protein